MITLSRRHIRSIRSTISQSLGITSRRSQAAVGFQATGEGIAITAGDGNIAIRHNIPNDARFDAFAIPLAALAECEGAGDEVITFRRDDNAIVLEWRDGGIPQVARHDVLDAPVLPVDVASATANDKSLIPALGAAVETADRESTRYALNCIQLRGSGQIVATDGRQAYVHGGFDFPWNDDVLVPASRVLTRKEFVDAAKVAISKSDEWVMFKADAWSIWLKINKDTKFPRIDENVPNTDAATTTLRLDDNDARFLIKAMTRLPGAREMNAPITLDLNGQVAVRAQADESSTELELSRSHREGEQLRMNTNRNFLARAARLGFREVHFHGPELCRSEKLTRLCSARLTHCLEKR